MPKGMGIHRRAAAALCELMVYLIIRSKSKRCEPGVPIGGNVPIGTPAYLADHFVALAAISVPLRKPFGHYAIRLAAGQVLDRATWRRLADEYLTLLGYGPLHPRLYVLHPDEDGHHLHIVVGRSPVGGGRPYVGRDENLRSTQILEALEVTYGLRFSPGIDVETGDGKRRRRPHWFEKGAAHEERVADWFQLQDDIDECLVSAPTFASFVLELQRRGNAVRAKIGVKGEVLGLSFRRGKNIVKGGRLGHRYAFPRLLEAGLDYDPVRDFEVAQSIAPSPVAVDGGPLRVDIFSDEASNGNVGVAQRVDGLP